MPPPVLGERNVRCCKSTDEQSDVRAPVEAIKSLGHAAVPEGVIYIYMASRL